MAAVRFLQSLRQKQPLQRPPRRETILLPPALIFIPTKTFQPKISMTKRIMTEMTVESAIHSPKRASTNVMVVVAVVPVAVVPEVAVILAVSGRRFSSKDKLLVHPLPQFHWALTTSCLLLLLPLLKLCLCRSTRSSRIPKTAFDSI